MSALRLVSFDLCPFVQRSTIALEEKGVEYQVKFIDLSNKPDWFLKISPHGRVPLLQVDDVVLFESAAILEYLDETADPRLHPADPLQRARDRAWFSVSDAINGSVYRMMTANDAEALQTQAKALNGHLRQLEPEVVGPLWHGEAFSALDACMYPGLQRSRWLDQIYPELDLFAGAPKVKAWEAALASRPSIVASTIPNIHTRFVDSLPGYGRAHT